MNLGLIFGVSLTLCAAVTYAILKTAYKLSLGIDGTRGVPRVGGLAIIVSITLVSVLAIDLPRDAIMALGAAGVVAAVGLLDDLGFGRGPLLKLAASLAAAAATVALTDVMGRLAKTKPGVSGEIQFTDALEATAREGGLEYCKLEGIRYDCGDKLGYLEAIVHTAIINSEFGPDFEAFLRQTLVRHGIAAE